MQRKIIMSYLRVFAPSDSRARSAFTYGLTPVVLSAFIDRGWIPAFAGMTALSFHYDTVSKGEGISFLFQYVCPLPWRERVG